MIQSCTGASFPLKTRSVLSFQSLDGDYAIQSRVSGLPHFSHAAFAEGREDLVRSKFLAPGKAASNQLSLTDPWERGFVPDNAPRASKSCSEPA
jgi:hypothetical protein